MKNIIAMSVLYLITGIVNAQSNNTSTIRITGTKFPFAIMQRWIDEFSKTHAGVSFELSKSIPPDSADLLIAAHAFFPGELKDDQTIIAVNR